MASCSQNISNIISNGLIVDKLINNVNFIIGFDRPKLFELNVNIYSNISISLISDNDPRTTLTIYDDKGDLYNTTPINTNILTIRMNLRRGKYYFCFNTNSFIDVKFNMKINIVENEEPINMELYSYFGNNGTYSFKKQKPPEIDLDLPVDMEIIDGSLPDGLEMTIRGEIYGTLPELDCVEHTKDNSASFQFFNEHENDETMSWGKVWRFKVRAWLSFSPETVPITQWMCIKIFNDWSNDRDDFLEILETMDDIIEYKYIYKTLDDIKLPDGLCITTCDDIEDIISPPIVGIQLESNCPLEENDIVDVVVNMDIDKIIIPPSVKEYVLDGVNDDKLIVNYRRFKAYLLSTPNVNIDSDNFILNIRSSRVLEKMVDYQNMTDIRKSDTKKDYYINYNEDKQLLEFAEFDKEPTFKKQGVEFSMFDPIGTTEYTTQDMLWEDAREDSIRKNPTHVYTWNGFSASFILK